MSNKFPSQVQDKFTVRFPEGMRDKIAEQAKKNNRSMNAEIILALEKYLESQKQDLPELSTKKNIQYSEMEEIYHLLQKNINLMQSMGRIFRDKELFKKMTEAVQTQAKVMKKKSIKS
ncbi:hypothetical protein GAPWKB11_0856 [Gilliamella apicola]|jgi:phage-related protein|nr:Arc family DNA-binding protein [Gilliamella apicola]KFA58967.1 hypothetical protein GAPWKB11_0856 [Gilliamella apicola]